MLHLPDSLLEERKRSRPPITVDPLHRRRQQQLQSPYPYHHLQRKRLQQQQGKRNRLLLSSSTTMTAITKSRQHHRPTPPADTNLKADNNRVVEGLSPSLLFRDYGSTLILGRSATGKSTLLERMLAHGLICPKQNPSKKNTQLLFLINVKSDEREKYLQIHPQITSLSKLSDITNVPENATLFVEDIIHLTKAEEIALRYYLNDHVHHRKLKIFCVGHTLFKTSLFGVVSLFNYVIFTSCPSNVPLLKQTLTYFRLEPETIAEYLEKFETSTQNKPDHYFFLNCAKLQLGAMFIPDYKKFVASQKGQKRIKTLVDFYRARVKDGGGGGDPGQQQQQAFSNFSLKNHDNRDTENFTELGCENKKAEKQVLERAKLIFDDHPHKSKALSLLSIITCAIPPSCLKIADLTIRFQRQNTSASKYISLIDYIECLLQSPNSFLSKEALPGARSAAAVVDVTNQTKDFTVLHHFISSFCHLPRSLILNKAFKK